MIVLVCENLVPNRFDGITIYPFIIVRSQALSKDVILINHERIHLQQQKELLFFPFFIWYGISFLYNLVIYKNRSVAYKAIVFEREAYSNEVDLDYLAKRKRYAFLIK